MKLKGVDGVHELLNVLEPIVEKKINTKLKTSVQQKYNLTEKIPSEQKRKMKLQITRENSKKISNIIGNNEKEIQSFLASGKSYSQIDRDRFATFYEGMQDATKRTSTKTIKIKQGKMKQKTHIGNLENYSFQRAEFLKYLGSVI